MPGPALRRSYEGGKAAWLDGSTRLCGLWPACAIRICKRAAMPAGSAALLADNAAIIVIGLLVGSLQTLINQGIVIAGGHFPVDHPADVLRALLGGCD